MKKKCLIYFDSCVLIDSISYKQGYKRVNIKRKFDIGNINPAIAEIFLSEINIVELTEHLKDSAIGKIAIKEGYSYFDLNKGRLDEIQLSKEQLLEINEIVKKQVVELPSVVIEKTKGFSTKDIKFIMKMCLNYSIFFIDAIHFLIADKAGCDYFVTSDIKFFNNLKRFLKDINSSGMIRILTGSSFKNSFFKQMC